MIVLICSLESIRSKEVIDITTGERLGYVDDAELNLEDSTVGALIIYGRERLFGILGRDDDLIIPCADICVIGKDVMLVKRTESRKLSYQTKNKGVGLGNLFR